MQGKSLLIFLLGVQLHYAINRITLMTVIRKSPSTKFEGDDLMENEKVRRAARIADVPLWRVAQQAGISEPTLTRWLRVPLSEEREQRLLEAISALNGGVRDGKT